MIDELIKKAREKGYITEEKILPTEVVPLNTNYWPVDVLEASNTISHLRNEILEIISPCHLDKIEALIWNSNIEYIRELLNELEKCKQRQKTPSLFGDKIQDVGAFIDLICKYRYPKCDSDK